MDDDAILSALTTIFHEVFDDPALRLAPAMSAPDVPGWDSMTQITIVVEVERRFGIKFQTADIETLQNVGEFIKLIGDKLAASGR